MVIVKRDHAKKKVYTEEQKEFIIANKETWRLIDFAKKFNVSHSTVQKWKVELGLSDGTKVRVKKEKDQEEQEYHFNWKIAKKHDFIFRSDKVINSQNI